MDAIAGMLTAAGIAQRLGGELLGHGDHTIGGFAGLDEAGPGDLVFIASSKWASRWVDCKAVVALVTRGVDVPGHDPKTRSLIVVDDAEIGMMMLLEAVAAELRPLPLPGVSGDARVHPDAMIGEGVYIGAAAVVEEGAEVGGGAVLHAGAVVERGAKVGENAVVGANAVLAAGCELGDRSILQQGVIVGSDGFGFRPDPQTGLPRRIPHLGTVEIGCDVEIGACSCVDRGKFGPTRIGDGTKIDNLVQVAHNVQIGRGVIIAALTGMAGSCRIEDGVVLGAQVGIAEHVRIGEGARIAATSGVMRDVPPGEDYAGTPARPARQTLREVAALRKLPDLVASMPRRESS
ncbi:MAG: UDP-3-O-(3-hydroxymyristoyl)glucosamine N-acyltransferase [Phycisphaerales bacterium]|jgi:UDP-3-O-[3-hydroxymyristoyl] glucosamine N-acyltransferase|nr:UDP-3-O-(3-hydroxymyristoyl)glucosamine N-acyltransferase [Phycisphaerales bacterium]MDP7574088.1 UDP-3-O-(3-hydroxymyristoyl)glucosamine N-acyltransferase [Phycisphaerales bacterium]|tara:strand:- start:433 stop:1476 length:1044 start_codon:yes stop_codon:yes gene_type:complete